MSTRAHALLQCLGCEAAGCRCWAPAAVRACVFQRTCTRCLSHKPGKWVCWAGGRDVLLLWLCCRVMSWSGIVNAQSRALHDNSSSDTTGRHQQRRPSTLPRVLWRCALQLQCHTRQASTHSRRRSATLLALLGGKVWRLRVGERLVRGLREEHLTAEVGHGARLQREQGGTAGWLV